MHRNIANIANIANTANTSERLERRMFVSAYMDFVRYMRATYGPGPWLPWRCRADDNWLGWCETYALDPLTGRPKPPPVREEQEAARAAS